MNKKIIALAIASLSGAAFAQSNVTISGIADVGIEVGNSGYGSKTRVQSGQSAGSRLIFKGSEKIDGNMEAFFNLEAGYMLDNGQSSNNGSLTQPALAAGPAAAVGGSGANVAATGSGSYLFNRTAVLGLKTSVGAFMIGRQYSPMFAIKCAHDTSACGGAASMGNTVGMVAGYADRLDNAMSYMVEMNGFSGALAYSSGSENNQTTFAGGVGEKDGKAWGMNLKYANGPVSVGWAYHNARPKTSLPAAIATIEDSAKAWLLGGSYDFSMAKVYANYSAGKLENGNFALGGANGTRLSDRRAWALGVSMPFGAHSVRFNLGKNDDRLTTDADFSFWGVHYEYAMSKRTAFYGIYAAVNNANRGTAAAPAGAGMSVGSALATNLLVTSPAQGGNYDPTALQLGVRHSF